MALKPERNVIAYDVNHKLGAAQEKGVLVCYSSTAGYVEVAADPSGKKVAGVLMVDVRNRDVRDTLGTTTNTRNYGKNEEPISGVVTLAKVGEIMTDDVDASDTFSAGDSLYITDSGVFSKVRDNSGCEKVGHAIEAKDSDGYLRVWLNITAH